MAEMRKKARLSIEKRLKDEKKWHRRITSHKAWCARRQIAALIFEWKRIIMKWIVDSVLRMIDCEAFGAPESMSGGTKGKDRQHGS